MYDVIVVGARCAGAPTAMLQARAGRRVLLLDRADTSTDVLSTHLLRAPAVARLAEWGLQLHSCPPIHTESMTVPEGTLRCDLAATHGSVAYAPRRTVLDPMLLNAAIEAGVDFRRASVTGVVHRDDRVVGVRIGEEEVYADLVVGADGMRSQVAKFVGAEEYDVRPTASCCYYSYWSGLPTDGLEGFINDGVGVGVVPTNDGRTLVSTYFPQDEFGAIRTDAQESYLKGILRCHPSLEERLAGATQVDRLYAMGDQRNYFRTPAGPGWVLVGDAGHHKDSITAWGMTHAFDQAQALADLGPEEFGRTRDEDLLALYEITLGTAQLRPADFGPLVAAAAQDAALANRVFQFLAGKLSQEQLMG